MKERKKHNWFTWNFGFTFNILLFFMFMYVLLITLRLIYYFQEFFGKITGIFVWGVVLLMINGTSWDNFIEAMKFIPKKDKKGYYWKDE